MILEGGERREKESEKHRCERETSIGCIPYAPQGTDPATQACALSGNRTGELLLCLTTPAPLSHTGQGILVFSKSTLSPCYIISYSLKIFSSSSFISLTTRRMAVLQSALIILICEISAALFHSSLASLFLTHAALFSCGCDSLACSGTCTGTNI